MTTPKKSTLPFGGKQRIGRYDLIAELTCDFGKRWVGAATEGDDRGRAVYLRQFPTDSLSLPELQLLNRAAVTAMVIRHPNVAAVVDVVDDAGRLTLVSEYREGESLAALLRLSAQSTSPMSSAVGLTLLADIVEAQRAAEKQWGQMVPSGDAALQGATHGGLMPDGVLLTTGGEVLVTDVGIVGALLRHSKLLRDPVVIPYRAPEQLTRGHGGTGRCDVFSAGVLAWEVMAGRALFGDPLRLQQELPQEPDELVKSLLHGPITPLDRLPGPGGATPFMIVDLLRNMLLRDPLKRYANLDKLSAAIAGLGRGLFANSADVATTVQRLAGAGLRIRRELVDFTRAGSEPDAEEARSAAHAAPRVAVSVPGPSAPPAEQLAPGGVSRSATLRFPAIDEQPPVRDRPSQRAALRPASERAARRSKPPPTPVSVPRPRGATAPLGQATDAAPQPVTEKPPAPVAAKSAPAATPSALQSTAPDATKADDDVVFDSAPPSFAKMAPGSVQTPVAPAPESDVHDRMTLVMPEQEAEVAASRTIRSDAPQSQTASAPSVAPVSASVQARDTNTDAGTASVAMVEEAAERTRPTVEAAAPSGPPQSRAGRGLWVALGVGLVAILIAVAFGAGAGRSPQEAPKAATPQPPRPETAAPTQSATAAEPTSVPDPQRTAKPAASGRAQAAKAPSAPATTTTPTTTAAASAPAASAPPSPKGAPDAQAPPLPPGHTGPYRPEGI